MSELLPCPFCGGTELYAERRCLAETVIVCDSCGVFGPGGQPEDDDDLEIEEIEDLLPGELTARREWNTRQPEPEKSASDWISVKDKPPSPEQGAKILAYGNGYVFECEFDDGVWCNLAGDSFTHWMPPLPLPPSVEVKK